MIRSWIYVLATLWISFPVAVRADGFFGPWLAQNTATGDWDGSRLDLVNSGVTPALNYTTDLMANPSGGRRQSDAYAAALYGSFKFDLEKLLGVKGLSFFASGTWTQGRDLSAQAIGNVFDVAQIYGGDAIRLSQLYFEQTLWEDRLNLAIGRLSAGNDFALAGSFGHYVSGAVNGTPASIPTNIPSFTVAPPFAQWGVRAKLQPYDHFYISTGVYNADPSVQADDEHGVDFKLNPGEGVLTLAEVGYRFNPSDGNRGLPNHFALGAYHDSSDFNRLDNPMRSHSGNYGVYAIAEQMIFQEAGVAPSQGLTLWGSLTYAPDQEINTLSFAAYGGLTYQGLITGRDNDVAALAVYYGEFSDSLPNQDFELALEVTYRIQFASWLYLQPDIQYIMNPNGDGIPDAVVIGAEISVNF